MEDQQQNVTETDQTTGKPEVSKQEKVQNEPVTQQSAQPEVNGGTEQKINDNQQGQPAQAPEAFKKATGQPTVNSEEKIWALVSYIPLIALMALVLKPGSDYIKLHGRQGLLIFLISFFSIFVYLVPYIGPVIGVIVHLALIGIAVFSMYQAFIGNWWKIPILGDIAELIPVDIFAKVTREAVMGEKVSEEIEQKSIEEQEAKTKTSNEERQEVASQQELPIEDNQSQSNNEENK